MRRLPAFTIVELLVVITIIVVLLAPAMDQAIYQTELAVCEARLHGAKLVSPMPSTAGITPRNLGRTDRLARARRVASPELHGYHDLVRHRIHRSPAMRRIPAFTLVELLVVITIIVILLAMLSPALDQAIYQAELAVCGSQMSATVKGLSIYAMDFKRSYPYRPTVAGGGETYPYQLNVGPQGAGTVPVGSDDRVPIRGYVDLAQLVDPLCRRVRLDNDRSWVYSSYALWWGWAYTGQEGMTRVGNRLTWTVGGQTYRVNWLVTDLDGVTPSWPVVQGSHPDHDNVMYNLAAEVGDHDGSNPVIAANNQVSDVTVSLWLSGFGVTHKRGLIEMNAAAADGAVTRYNAVDYNNVFDNDHVDPRMAPASPKPGGQPSRDTWINVPVGAATGK